MDMLINVLLTIWDLLLDSSIYILFGLLISGFLKVFLNPSTVAGRLGDGRFGSVWRAAILGIPLPLCSCGVLPAAVGLRKQGASRGATTAFLISTPESGVDSIAVTYALLDPLMTAARPVAAFVTALAAGLMENLLDRRAESIEAAPPDLSCPIDGCCDGVGCPSHVHRRHHNLGTKLGAGLKYAFGSVWTDMAAWFFTGLILAGLITAFIPQTFLEEHLGGGIQSMLIMLVVGIPFYICATASTPVAASLILKGVSPGTALVFLLAGPATNITSLTVLLGTMGKRATAVYLGAIAVFAVLFGLAVDGIYAYFGLSIQAVIGRGGDIMPYWLKLAATVFLIVMSVKPLLNTLGAKLSYLLYCIGVNKGCREEVLEQIQVHPHGHSHCSSSSCNCRH